MVTEQDKLDAVLDITRKVRKRDADNRPAFLAALIMDRAPQPMNPHHVAAIVDAMVIMARRFKSAAERDCNIGLTEREEARRNNLGEDFKVLAAYCGFRGSFSGDPRGACCYLYNPDNENEGDGFGGGWAVYAS